MSENFCFTLLVIVSLVNEIFMQETNTTRITFIETPEDATLNFTQLAEKYGHKAEEHEIITADGYVLITFRIIGNNSSPVLLTHGILGTAEDFIIRGNTSLAITLANAGYDVWAINFRGSRYSRNHLQLNPDKDRSFWEYSIDELGYFDTPANIDYILSVTGQDKLSIIGFSQGTASTFVLGATRPEYNDKVKVFIALAPICHLQYTERLTKSLIELSPFIGNILDILHIDEVLGYNSTSKLLFDIICTYLPISYDICLNGVLAQLMGEDPKETEKDFFAIVVAHFPAGTSRRNLIHFGQIGNNKLFARYDYGRLKNMEKYKSNSPPEYNLGNFSMPTVLIAGKDDKTSTLKDMKLLKRKLKCVKSELVIDTEKFNHLDHIWGRNSHKLIFPFILTELAKNYD